MKHIIYSWARQRGAPTSEVLGGWGWLAPWSRGIARNMFVMYPLLVTALMLTAAAAARIVLSLRRNGGARRVGWRVGWGILLLPAFSLVYWFVTAPDARFANALFWLLAVASALVALAAAQGLLSSKRFAVALCGAFVVANLYCVECATRNYYILGEVSSSGWQPVKTVPLVQEKTLSGLSIYVPASGDQCWDAPLPCATHLDPALRLRVPGNIRAGFTISSKKYEREGEAK